jgi:transcriptional regulator with PAS, ATPase and Fis domain
MQDQLMTTLTVSEKRTAGSQAETDPDIRIIVTTETDLVALVEAGTFSRELYDHLDLFELTVPPLRDRKDDIYLLCRYFFDQYRRELDKPVDAISPEVVEILLDYDFPGNVRELKNIIERAVIIVGGKTITRRHLPVRFLQDKQDECLMESDQLATMAELEKRYIIKVLEVTGGNKSKTAEILGISRAALWRKLKLFKAERSEE